MPVCCWPSRLVPARPVLKVSVRQAQRGGLPLDGKTFSSQIEIGGLHLQRQPVRAWILARNAASPFRAGTYRPGPPCLEAVGQLPAYARVCVYVRVCVCDCRRVCLRPSTRASSVSRPRLAPAAAHSHLQSQLASQSLDPDTSACRRRSSNQLSRSGREARISLPTSLRTFLRAVVPRVFLACLTDRPSSSIAAVADVCQLDRDTLVAAAAVASVICMPAHLSGSRLGGFQVPGGNLLRQSKLSVR